MNIYFACSITGGRELESVYEAFVSALSTDGHEVPTAHLVLPGVTEETRLEPRMVYERDTAWIYNCDVLIAEVSVPSHGVGYEIGYALSAAKPALCLVQEGRKLSKMISGNHHPLLRVRSYATIEAGVSLIREFINQVIL